MCNREKQEDGTIDQGWAYDYVWDVERYMKRKRTRKCVILHDALLPQPCANPKCRQGGVVLPTSQGGKADDNRTDLYPANYKGSGKPIVMVCQHYVCSWENLLDYVYGPLYDEVMS